MSGPKRDAELERIADEGKEDGKKPYGSYEPPHGVISTLVSDTAKKSEDNAVYDEAFHEARHSK